VHAVPRPDAPLGEPTRGVPSVTVEASVTTKEVALPTALKSLQPLETDSGTDLRGRGVGPGEHSGALRAPLVVRTRKAQFTVNQVSFWVDDPRQAAARIRDRVDTRTGA